MSDIKLNPRQQYKGFGDRLDALGLAKCLYDKHDEPVTIHMFGGTFSNFSLMSNLFNMKCSLKNHPRSATDFVEFNSYFRHDQTCVEYNQLIDEINDFPKIIPKDLNLELPKKFVVAQFDALQTKRCVSPKEKNRIINYYKEQGYDVIIIGGQSKDKRFGRGPECIDNIIYAMSKADKYIGVDSGMMNLAKFVMPIQNLHVYTDDRVDDPFFSTFLSNCQKKGAKVNYSR